MSKYQLILNKIGRFSSHRLFELENETVFFGANEAGKTTVLDAMVVAQTSYSRRQDIYKTIVQGRYDDEIDIKLKRTVDNEEVAKLDHGLVNDLLLVRASALSLNIEGASWVEEVKNNLFVGGVNPRTIIDTIIAMEKKPMKKNRSPLVEVKQLQTSISEKEQNLRDITEGIEGFTEALGRQEQSRNDEQALKLERERKTKQHETASAELSEEREKLNRVYMREGGLLLAKLEKLKAKLSSASAYSDDREAKLEDFYKSRDTLKNQENSLHQNLATTKEEQNQKDQTINAEQKPLRECEERKNEAETTLNRLAILVSEQKERENKKPLAKVGIGSGLLVIGLVTFFLAEGMGRYAALLAMLIGLITLIAPVFRKGSANDAVPGLKAEVRTFNQRCKLKDPCPDTDYDSTRAYLRHLQDEYTKRKNDVDHLINQREEKEAKILGIKSDQSNVATELIKLNAQIERELPEDVGTLQAFSEKLREKKSDQQALIETEEQLEKMQKSIGLPSHEALVQHIEHKLIESRTYPLDEKPLSQNELAVLEAKVHGLQAEKESISQKLAELATDLTRSSVETQIKVGALSEQQVRAEKDLEALKARREKGQLEMDSLLLLKDIVESIEGDTDEQFKVLGDDLSKYLDVMLSDNRTITFNNLARLDAANATDHYGSELAITRLSSGTRDAFYLAARLAFLEKVQVQGDAFLLLDDPFVFMDRTRAARAMKAILLFRQEKELPIALFTKDETTKDDFLSIFPSAALVEMDSLGIH
ncbi:MAG: hypothetical protein ACNYPE_09125 [Candidatus Azotimanducaceae bacterium WSBS_2022_MAG_OTU7]